MLIFFLINLYNKFTSYIKWYFKKIFQINFQWIESDVNKMHIKGEYKGEVRVRQSHNKKEKKMKKLKWSKSKLLKKF